MTYQGMTGQGTTAVLSTNAITGCVRSLTLPELTQDKIDASCLDTTGFMKYIPGDLTDPGECSLEIIFDPTFDFDAIIGVLDTLTITFALGTSTNTTNATLIGTGFITSYSLPDLSTNDLAVVNVTFAYDGQTGPAFTVES